MSSKSRSVKSPWVENNISTQGKRRSIRLKKNTNLPSPPAVVATVDRGSKRKTSPIGSTAKRMRLLGCEDHRGESSTTTMVSESSPSSSSSIESSSTMTNEQTMNTVGTYEDDEGRKEESDDETEEEDRRRGGGHSDGKMNFRDPLSSVQMDSSDDEEREMEDIIDDEDEEEEIIDVDKTDIITSDEGEDEDRENLIDGPKDSYERYQRFRKLSIELGQRFEMKRMKEPNQLTKRCHGVGPAHEVWSVLVHKDDLLSICNGNFLELSTVSRRPVTPMARATLVDWVQEVCCELKLYRETYHLALDYMDRFMARCPSLNVVVELDKYQLIGTTAIFVAAKYEEIYPPKVEEVVQYTDGACSVDEVRRMELQMLKVLEWELNVITPLHWAHLFLELLTGNPKMYSSSRLSLLSSPSSSVDGHYIECVNEQQPEELPATSSSCMRDEFMHLAFVMDTVLLNVYSRQYSNRVLATAVLYATFDAADAIHQVTGLSMSDVSSAIYWVEPVVMYCERHRVPYTVMPTIDGVKSDSVQHIQLHRITTSENTSVDEVLVVIDRLRNVLQQKRPSYSESMNTSSSSACTVSTRRRSSIPSSPLNQSASSSSLSILAPLDLPSPNQSSGGSGGSRARGAAIRLRK